MYIFIVFFYFTFVLKLFPDGIGRTLNLMYFQEGIKVVPSLNLSTLKQGSTFNTYIRTKQKDTRFINLSFREGGIEITKKVIVLLPNSELKFRFQIPLDHKVKLEYLGKEAPLLFWNGELIDETTVLISNEKSTLSLKSQGKEIILTRLTLEPTFRAFNKKNFLFTVVDSLRADVVGFNGANYGVTPNMDEVAKTSIVLGQHLVNSGWTRPSTLIFFTGKYPSKTFINLWDYPIFPSEKNAFYESKIFPLPALLSSLGYKTIMIGNNPFLTDLRQIGIDVGFEEVYEFSLLGNDTPKITNKFLSLLNEWEKESRPLFIFLNYNDPHKPYEPPYEFLAKVKGQMNEKKRAYLGEVAYVDSELGKIISKLKEKDFWEKTFFLLTSDHGEVMDPAHAISKFTGVYTLFGHGQGLYEEDIHTPFLFRFPNQAYGIRVNKVSRSIDILPTILDVLNINYEEKEYDGQTLVPLWEGFETQERVYYGETRGVKGVRLGGWKLMKKTYEFHRLGPAWSGEIGDEKEYLFRYGNGEREENTYADPQKKEELRKYFTLGNTEKTLYCFRIFSNQMDKNSIQIHISTRYGNVVFSNDKFESIQDEDVRVIYKGLIIKKTVEGKFEKKYCFFLYPDIFVPYINIFLNGRNIQRGEYGVGNKDIYPENCPITSEHCLPLYLSNQKTPPLPKKFRIQFWVVSPKTKIQTEKVILEKEALDILRKQGYVK